MYRPGLSPLEIGIFPACGFRLFSRPHERWTDEALLAALGVSGREIPCDWPPSGVHAVSITEHGEWTHVNDAYGLWNSGRWRDAVRTLASAGDLFTFLLPDPDHSYRFAYYRSGSRVRLRVVHDGWWENGPLALLVDEGQPARGAGSLGPGGLPRAGRHRAGARHRWVAGRTRPLLRLGLRRPARALRPRGVPPGTGPHRTQEPP